MLKSCIANIFFCMQGEKGEPSITAQGIKGEPGSPGLPGMIGPKVRRIKQFD